MRGSPFTASGVASGTYASAAGQFGIPAALADGTTDATTAIQALADAAETAGGGYIHTPITALGFRVDGAVSLASNVSLVGDGYGSFWWTSASGTHTFVKNKGWATDASTSNIEIRNHRFRRTTVLLGSEGPYDNAINLRKVDGAFVDRVWCEGSMGGVQFEGCTNFGWDKIYGYRNGDVTLRINHYPGAGSPGTPSAGGTRPGVAYSVEAGYQLGDGSALPTPSGPVGSAFVITQDDVELGTIIGVDTRTQVMEIGNTIRNLDVARIVAIVNTAGRSGKVLLANYNGVHIGSYEAIVNAAGTVGINGQGDGVSQVQNQLTIDSATGWDTTGDTTNRILVTLARDIVSAKVGKIAAYGMSALLIGGGGTPLIGTQNIDVDSVYAEGAVNAGVNIASGGASGGPFRIGRIHTVNCGRDTGSAVKQRAGVIFQNGTSLLTVDTVRSEDTRSGGSRTQTYGIYNSGSAVDVGNCELTNNLTAPYVADGSPTFCARFGGTGSPDSVVVASVGSTYLRKDGTANNGFYVKQTGDGATGWRSTTLPAPTTVLTTNGTWPIPANAATLRITAVGCGGSGGGAGSAAAAQLQSGGGGGGAGADVSQVVAVGANTTLNVTIGAGGTSPNGGAAGGNAGTVGNNGGNTRVTATGIDVLALGGSGGNASGASSTSSVNGGVKGGASNGAKGGAGPGFGGIATGASGGGAANGYGGAGGAAGGSATATLGGGSGGAGSATTGGTTGSQAGTSAGADGADAAANTGAGGGGGGGGATGTGAGGKGGAGGSGFVIIEVLAWS